MDLSIIIPVFDSHTDIQTACETLDRSLTSLKLDYEILLLDDVGQGRSRAVFAEISARRRRVHFLCSKKQLSFGAGLRTLMDKAQGDIVTYLDAADLSWLSSFSVLVQKMHQADIVTVAGLGRPRGCRGFCLRGWPRFDELAARIFLGFSIKDLRPKLLLLRKSAIPVLDLRSTGNNILAEIFVKAKKKKLVAQEVFLEIRLAPG